jgi:ATP-dependent exoDNAse (exonuclease V) alpha subunit
MLLKNDYKLDVRNGQRGRISKIDPALKRVTLQLDGGLEKRIDVTQYGKLEYGWASTTHKAQGATVDRCYIYGHTQESMASRQATYVQISRAREDTQLFVVNGARSIQFQDSGRLAVTNPLNENKKMNAEESLREMARYWGVNVAKNTTLEFGVRSNKEQTLGISL